MPRTKLERSSRAKLKPTLSRNVTKNEPPEIRESSQLDIFKFHLKNFEQDLSTEVSNMKNRIEMFVDELHHFAIGEHVLMKPEDTKKTMLELRTEKSFSATSMMYDAVSLLKNLNSTTNTTCATNKTKKPTDDEGYLTAGESGTTHSELDSGKRTRSSSVTRHSRQPARTARATRTSRSLSRSKTAPKKNVTIQASEKKTPDRAMKPPIAFGMVTPKVKPNMPVSVFRRPMQGEMAISMQGSPLLVSGIVTETCANVNIPLQDGKILSLQPSRGLRMSEIPYLDEETRRQLTTLRDNLNKVVKLAYDD